MKFSSLIGEHCWTDTTMWERKETNSLSSTPIPTNCLLLLMHLEFKVGHLRKCPGILTQLPRLSGVMCEPGMTDKNPDIHPPLKCPDDALTELSCCWAPGATEIEWWGLVSLLGALWRRYIGSWWLSLTVVIGALVYLLYMWQQIFNSIFLSSKSHNGGKGVGEGMST